MALRWIHELILSVLFKFSLPVFEGKNNIVIKLTDTYLLILYRHRKNKVRDKGT